MTRHDGTDDRGTDGQATDQQLSNQYRALADETVPQWMEDKILREAARGLQQDRPARWYSYWKRPLAFAATAGLCIAIFVNPDPVEQLDTPPPAATEVPQDAAAAMSRAIEASERRLQQLDNSVNGTRPTLPVRYCGEAETRTAQAWLDCISELQRLGDTAAADAEYRQFRQAYPELLPTK